MNGSIDAGGAPDKAADPPGVAQPGGVSPGDGAVGRAFGQASVGTIGMWIFLATDAMGFGGLLMVYAALRARSTAWPDPSARFDRSLAGALTFLLLFSGATMTAALAAARQGRRGSARLLLMLTALMGVAFVAGQAIEFRDLAGARHVGLTADHAAALFYVITGYHGLHVMAGVLVLVLAGLPQVRGEGGAGVGPPAGGIGRRAVGVLEVVSLYWQFVDVVWIVIFTVLYLLPVARG